MPRRSARLAETNSAVASDVRLNGASPAHADSPATRGNHEESPKVVFKSRNEDLVRRRKRQKRQKQLKANKPNSQPSLQFKNVRGRRGALKDIVEMPLDILQEIFMYLTPVEVLALSRMCKALRRILMTKSAERVWRQARLNLDGFPDCPDDLNEAQFASFVFGGLCDYCNKRKGRYFIWANRRRCCGACIKNSNGLVQFSFHYSSIRLQLKSSSWWDVVPSINSRSKTETRGFDVYNLFCKASAIRLLKEYEEYQRSDYSTQYAWECKKLNERRSRIAHGRLCETWLAKQDDNRIARLDEIRQRRYKAIKQRLTDLGWGKELETISDMDKWPAVRQPKDLTDRIWKNIKDDIIAKLKEHRACQSNI